MHPFSPELQRRDVFWLLEDNGFACPKVVKITNLTKWRKESSEMACRLSSSEWKTLELLDVVIKVQVAEAG